MKLLKKNKKHSLLRSRKDFAELTLEEKKQRNKAVQNGNHIERRWFNDPRIHK